MSTHHTLTPARTGNAGRRPWWLPAVFAIAALACLGSLPSSGRQVVLQAGLANPVLLAGERQTTHLKVGLTGFELERVGERPPVNVALVIDRSGSMSGDKLAKAREAAILAVRRLGRDDIVSVVSYSSNVTVLVPATRLEDKDYVIAKIRQVSSGGGTALFAGVSKGAAETRKFLDRDRVNRVILLSDGLANEGPSTPGELGDLGRALGRERISVTTIGLGGGYNEDLMVRLAQNSDGNHAFAASANDLIAIFDREFRDVLSVCAQEIRIRFLCSPGIRPVRVLGREAHISGQNVDVHLNQLYGGQEKYAVLELDVPSQDAGTVIRVGDVEVTYANSVTRTQDRLTSRVQARVSASKREVAQNIDKGAAAAAVVQEANGANIRAMKLRDAGRADEAAAVLYDNAKLLRAKASELNAPELDSMSEVQKEDAQAVKSSSWNVFGRKRMRENQYRYSNQQKK
ncbi:MAG: VWA domain-containing protein [Lentisphaerae bacterium]|jgi:Ca-activated chloride channel homolog|nr:VWA domain-containing protein [Lentisphaerota bacterium]MBT5605479.1 VWA domain-containing protein [Lentisphaerota bacterium]MBT7060090.1 VWA domain-containing protein [Lentisphaerota bacterium]MBT7840850.1 VWA domain-containing protein [Lentisphaerota bacterium]